MENLFEKALFKSELLEFGMGLGEYFIRDIQYDEHWVLGAWQKHIIPLINSLDLDIAQSYLIKLFLELIYKEAGDKYERVIKVLYHLYVFYYMIDNNKIDTKISLIAIEYEINAFFEKEITNLIQQNDLSKLQNIKIAISQIKKRGGLKDFHFQV